MSNVLAATVALLTMALFLSVRLAWVVTVALPLAGTAPNSHVTVMPPWHAPWVVMIEV